MRKLFALFLLLACANQLFAQSPLQQYREAKAQCEAQAKVASAHYEVWSERHKKFKIRFEALPKQKEEVNKLIELVGDEENRMGKIGEGKSDVKDVGFFLHNATRWPNPYMTHFDNSHDRSGNHWVNEGPSSNAWKFFFNNYLAIKNKATQAVMAYKQEEAEVVKEAEVVNSLSKKWTELGQEHLKRKQLINSLLSALSKEEAEEEKKAVREKYKAAKALAVTNETLGVAKDASLGVAASSLTTVATETNKFLDRLSGVTSKLEKAKDQIDAIKAGENIKDAWGISDDVNKQIHNIRKLSITAENAAAVENEMSKIIEKGNRVKKGFAIMENEFSKVASSNWSNVPSGGLWGYVFADAMLDAHHNVQSIGSLTTIAESKLREAKAALQK